MAFQYSGLNVINIFTDASTNSVSDPQSFACSGFFAIQNNMVIGSDFKVLNGVTSQFGELYAIMMGLTFMNTDVWSKRYNYRAEEVNGTVYNLISDSLYSLTCLRKVISEWVKATNEAVLNRTHPTFDYSNPNTPPDLLRVKGDTRYFPFFIDEQVKKKKEKNKKKKHKEKPEALIVADQEVLLHCMGLIVHTQKQINSYHIKSHMNEKGDVSKAGEAFAKYNYGVNPTDSELRSMIHWNDMVDNTTRMHLKTVLDYNRNLPNTVNWPMRYYPLPEHQRIYQNLIR
jgi:hypothetical protein